MNFKLYEMPLVIKELEKMFDENEEQVIDTETGEVINILDMLDQIQMERKEKIGNLAAWVKNLTAESKALKEEEEKLYKRRKAKETKIEQIENWILNSMLLCGDSKLETTKAVVTYRTSSAVEILNLEQIPDIYKEQKITFSPIKKEISQAIKNGTEIPGARLVENKNLQIK